MAICFSRDRIRRLNRAGLDHLQISIDNVVPDEVSNEEPEGAGSEAAVARRGRRVRRDRQLGGRRRHPQSGGCADHRATRARAGVFDDGGHHPRRNAAGCASSASGSEGSWRSRGGSASRCSTSRTTTGFKRTSRTAGRTSGTAAPAAAISISVKTASSIGAPSSAAIRASRWSGMAPRICRREYHQREELRAHVHRGLCASGRTGRRAAPQSAGGAGAVVSGARHGGESACRHRSGSDVGVRHQSPSGPVPQGCECAWSAPIDARRRRGSDASCCKARPGSWSRSGGATTPR